jgi:glycosyltransferase involved in cell wall biosynthesis
MNITILTNFKILNPAYSLVSIVLDQIATMNRYGHRVKLLVAEQFEDEENILEDKRYECEVKKVVPHPELIDYDSIQDLTDEHKQVAENLSKILLNELNGFDFCFSHDFVFTGWNAPYCAAIQKLKYELKDLRWLHWIHSIPPSPQKDWWNLRLLGRRHRLVYPSETDHMRVATAFRTDLDGILVIPHTKDARTFYDVSDDVWTFIDKYPIIMSSDILSVIAASTDRLGPKRLREAILISKYIKRAGWSVCLVCANSHAVRKPKSIEEYKAIARRNGLSDQEFIFTSEFQAPRFENGIPRRFLRELMLLSNLHLNGSREESFGLTILESALTGVMPVLNHDLGVMREVANSRGLYFSFGSCFKPLVIDDEAAYLESIAGTILSRIKQNEGVSLKGYVRKTYNLDNVYLKHYLPILSDLSW